MKPSPWSKHRRAACVGAFIMACATGALGCTATVPRAVTVETYPEPIAVRAQIVPTDIYAYPRVWYNGSYVYLVDGRWYYPTNQGWRVYRREPQELSRQRTRIHQAPERYYRRAEPAYPRELDRERRRMR